MRRRLDRAPCRRLAQPHAPAAVGETLELTSIRCFGDLPVAGDRHGAGDEGAGADLDDQSRNRGPVRGRIDVLDWANVRGYRAGENPRAGAGISTTCCRPSEGAAVGTTPPCPTPRSAFMARAAQEGSIAARALEFAILTAAQDGRGARRAAGPRSISSGLWAVPADG